MSYQSLNKKVFVFTAHPDDHLCCAGTLMFLKEKGFKIHEIVATDGEKGPWWISQSEQKKEFLPEELKKERRKEINEASKIIGTDQLSFLELPDGEIVMGFQIVERIMKLIREEKPVIVFTMNPNDYHNDHRQIAKIVLEALNRAPWFYHLELGKPYNVPVVLLMEGFYFGKAHFTVDITPYLKRKKAILDVYCSQINPREKKLLESINFYRAFFSRDEKVLAAESFEIPKNMAINLNQLIEIFKK